MNRWLVSIRTRSCPVWVRIWKDPRRPSVKASKVSNRFCSSTNKTVLLPILVLVLLYVWQIKMFRWFHMLCFSKRSERKNKRQNIWNFQRIFLRHALDQWSISEIVCHYILVSDTLARFVTYLSCIHCFNYFTLMCLHSENPDFANLNILWKFICYN